jgi:hypothetical protein
VAEYVVHRAPASLVEVVHIQLPHERVEIVVSKVSWKQKVLKLGFIDNFEANAVFTPSNIFLEILRCADLEKFNKKVRDVGTLSVSTVVHYRFLICEIH